MSTAKGAESADSAEHVDAVVVGSGFGGSVTAFRLAEAGRSVVLLERGKPYPPGAFARTPAQMAKNFWDPSAGLHGLFDIWAFSGLEGVVSSGLGGGSLIYANVLLRKDERWFVHESPVPGGGYENWPISRTDLDPHYDRAEAMLGATRYPYPDTTKTLAMEEAAHNLGLDVQRPPLAITFAAPPGATPAARTQIPTPDYGNIHGATRLTCRLCGECDLGCNDGAKNTLDHTYLSAASHHGADIRTRCEVRGFNPLDGGGYEVRYVVHDPETEGHKTATDKLPIQRLTCDRLVLGAGTFGSTYLLLRNRTSLPGLSRALGSRFSGNGDLLAFLLGATREPGRAHRTIEGSRGPVITTAIRVADAADGDGTTGRGYYVEDAGYPLFADWLVETSQTPLAARRFARFALGRLLSRFSRFDHSEISSDLATLLGTCNLSDGSLPLLGMGRDVPDGVMSLRRGRLAIDWTTETSLEYFESVRSTMRDLADQLGAKFEDNPLWWTKRVVTVHPIGGAPMGRHVGEGVCDPHGEVFGFPGLHVHDGSVLPGPVGANPSLTIAAVADRGCDRMLSQPWPTTKRRSGRATAAADRGSVASPAKAATAAAPPPSERSVSFTEQMKGFVALGVSEFEEGRAEGRSLDQRLMFELTITSGDVERFVSDAAHQGTATGYVESDVLGGRLDVEQGWFNLFVADSGPDRRRMLYRLFFRGGGGNPLTLTGFKDVHDDPGMDVWRDTSTLYVRILDGHVHPDGDAAATVVGAGVITIHLPDFLKQLTTFRASGDHPGSSLDSFGKLFLGQLWDVYGAHLLRHQDTS